VPSKAGLKTLLRLVHPLRVLPWYRLEFVHAAPARVTTITLWFCWLSNCISVVVVGTRLGEQKYVLMALGWSIPHGLGHRIRL
jgi:hypothetical protein